MSWDLTCDQATAGGGVSGSSGNSPQVKGTQILDPGVKTFSSYWWFKAKVIISAPNPSGTVSIQIMPAGAEMGPPGTYPENVGGSVSITGQVSPAGVFTSSTNTHVGFKSSVAIGLVPGSTDYIYAVIEVTAISVNSNNITITGELWAETTSVGGAVAKTSVSQWEEKVAKQ